MSEIEKQTGLKEEQCYFGLSFRFLTQSQTWVLSDEYRPDRHWHTHAFYHSYSPQTKKTLRISDQQIHLSNYFKNYKSTIKKLALMDTVLVSKTTEKSDQRVTSAQLRKPGCFS